MQTQKHPFSTKSNDHVYRRLKPKKNENMTICIATICEVNTFNPRIVFASDRLVTDEDDYTFEIGMPKGGRLSSNCFLMEAGNVFRAEKILQSFNDRFDQVKLKNMTINEIVNEFSNDFKKIFNESLESEIFESRGLSKNYFYENISKFPDWYVLTIDQELRHFDFGVAFIIMGFDIQQEANFTTAHIYKLTDNGEIQNYDKLGFVMIGIGEKLSLPEYTQDKYSPNNSLDDAMIRTYWAKRMSERMAGVGKTTDFGLIWLQKDTDDSEIQTKDTLLEEHIVKEYLDEPFEDARNQIQNMREGIKTKLQELITGKKSN